MSSATCFVKHVLLNSLTINHLPLIINHLKMTKTKFYIILTAIFSLCCAIFSALLFVNAGMRADNSDEFYEQAFEEHHKIYSPVIPSDLDFCGEKVPLDVYHVRERMDRELLVNCYWQSNTIMLLKRSNRYFPTIEKILKEEGVPDDFKYLALAESGFIYNVSGSGAAGFWQFLAPTAKKFDLQVNDDIDERYNLEKATRAACQYLKSNYQKFGSWTLAAAAYNAGEGRINTHVSKQSTDFYYDMHLADETSRYVFRILALKTICKNPNKYGFMLRKKDLYPEIPFTTVTTDSTISDLFAFAQSNGVSYQMFKAHNPWLRSSKLPNKERLTYTFKIVKCDSLSCSALMPDCYENNCLIDEKTFTRK